MGLLASEYLFKVLKGAMAIILCSSYCVIITIEVLQWLQLSVSDIN